MDSPDRRRIGSGMKGVESQETCTAGSDIEWLRNKRIRLMSNRAKRKIAKKYSELTYQHGQIFHTWYSSAVVVTRRTAIVDTDQNNWLAMLIAMKKIGTAVNAGTEIVLWAD